MSFFLIKPQNVHLDLEKAIQRIKQSDKQRLRQGKGKKMPIETYATSKPQGKSSDS